MADVAAPEKPVEPVAPVPESAATKEEAVAPTLLERKGRSRAASPAPRAPGGGASKKEEEGKAGFFDGFAGTVDGSFFKPPKWVDLAKPAGSTSMKEQVEANPKFRKYITGSFIFFSPNLVWLSFALLDYFVFPYDLESAKTWAVGWVAKRFASNMLIVFGFVGFWHFTLYILGWGQRPFNPARKYRFSKVAHNMWYNVLGTFQWTIWEALFMHCYATGRMPYIPDSESFGTNLGLVQFVAACFWVALWRDFHFYFAHRFLHIKVLYKYVHSLHHRNTDIEPFAGLCMHPIEHLFYFACAGPALYVKASPFAFMWFGIHLLLSPAASHSGFEDNMQSDQFHYAHHRFFECNYGTGSIPYDHWFGTFRDTLNSESATYKGASTGATDMASAAQADAKATLLGLPKWDEFVYNVLMYVALPLLVGAVAVLPKGFPALEQHGLTDPRVLALLMSTGPLALGALLLAMTSRRPFANPRLTFLYPFHKERWFGAFGLNVVMSLSVTVLPVYHMIHMLLAEPGQGIYFSIWGK